MKIAITSEQREIPTYVTGPDEKNPIFFEKRNVQGASGAIFPMAYNNRLGVDFRPVPYRHIGMENEYIQVGLLPELGGRIYSALDKSNGYDFIYRNRVIKPQQIGLCGPWISGGIEFNWPQHHRPTTFMPVDYGWEHHEDGSATVWMGETDPLCRMKGMVGITLYPGKSYIEAKIRLFNQTPYPQTFLWWANLAVAVNEHYQSIFPKDIHWASDHAWALTTAFPVIAGRYKFADFGAGIDVQKFSEVPLPSSFFTYDSRYDFLAGYDYGKQAGIVHAANHHISTGKKVFNWGVSDFSSTWFKNLSDEDGPYLELMTGVYSCNQPDFSWIMPFETKQAEQYWFPIRDMITVDIANTSGALGAEFGADRVSVTLNATEAMDGCTLLLLAGDSRVSSQRFAISPEKPFAAVIDLGDARKPHEYEWVWLAPDGRELLRFRPERPVEHFAVPDPLPASPQPEELDDIQDLYQHALHIWQYRHPYFEAEPYLERALRLRPKDIACSLLLGKIWMDRGDFRTARELFDRAAAQSTVRNPNPYDTEPFYQAGVLACLEERFDEAYGLFYKAVWGFAWKAPAYCFLAALDARLGNYASALKHIELSLAHNQLNNKAQRVKAAVLRLLGRYSAAEAEIDVLLSRDGLDQGGWFEKFLLNSITGSAGGSALPESGSTGGSAAREDFLRICSGRVDYVLDTAIEYANLGSYDTACQVLELGMAACTKRSMLLYYAGYYARRAGDEGAAERYWRSAGELSPAGVLHSRLESIPVLAEAARSNSADSRAPYLLGNIAYGKRMFSEAIRQFEVSVQRKADFPTVYRNLAIGYFDNRHLVGKAGELIRQAFSLDPGDERIFYEYIQYQRNAGVPLAERIALIESHPELLDRTDELYIKIVETYMESGDYSRVCRLLEAHTFHPYEGGEMVLPTIHLDVWTELGKQALACGDAQSALQRFTAAGTVPENYHVGNMGFLASQSRYYQGLAWEALGKASEARACFEAVCGATVMRLEQQYYLGLSRAKLGLAAEAAEAFQGLLQKAADKEETEGAYPYFTVSLVFTLPFEHDLKKNNAAECRYLRGLALLGLGRYGEAGEAFEQALQVKPFLYKPRVMLKECRAQQAQSKGYA